MDSGEVKITLTTLFELLKTEKDREDLQELEPEFFEQVSEYLYSKKLQLNKSTDSDFSQDKSKLRNQIHNILKIVKDLYGRRERKIIKLAEHQIRSNSSVIDSSALLPQEKELFDQISKILLTKRENLLKPLLRGDLRSTNVKKETVKIKFLISLPEFVDSSDNVIGPFNEGDEAEIPANIANMLIDRNQAEKL